mgnify:CR=1 FL=1
MTVQIVRGTRFTGTPNEIVYFTAFCTRCHREVRTANRMRPSNYEWATKAAAVKNAQAHADAHTAADKAMTWAAWDVVEEVS